MKIVTAAEMRAIEQAAFARGVSQPALMARAGHAVARETLALLEHAAGQLVVVLVGPGNNGGDGLVAAERLVDAGVAVAVWLYRRAGPGTAPVAANLLERVTVLTDDAALAATLARAGAIVDALFGTGQRDQLPTALADVLRAVNARAAAPGARTVAVDVPTGINADTGAVAEVAFQAELTVTLGRPKPGLYLPPGLRFAGHIVVDTLGLDDTSAPAAAPRLLTRADALARLPRRAVDAHKGDAGSLLIVGGSGNYLGAPALAAGAALRAGAGLVTLAVPRSIAGAVATWHPEATYLPLAEAGWGVVGPEAAGAVRAALDRYTALQVGNGLGRERPTEQFLSQLFGLAAREGGMRPTVPALVDADGLNWLSTIDRWWEALRGWRLVLTPHPGEMARLRGMETRVVAADPWDVARDAARAWGQVVVLKGGHSVVATPDGTLWVAPQANPALAAAGTGDTLAGLLAGFLTQGLAPADAAILGLYLGTRAGELARAATGTLPLVASDLPWFIGQAIRELEGTPPDRVPPHAARHDESHDEKGRSG